MGKDTEMSLSASEAAPKPEPPQAPEDTTEPAGRRGIGNDLGQRLALVGCWALMIVIFWIVLGSTFMSWNNFGDMFSSQTVLLVLALGLILPLTSGDFDLSVASVLTVTSVVVALLNVKHGWPIGLAALAGLGVALSIGLINGLLIVLFEVDSFIVTLGSSTILAGVALWLSGGATIVGTSTELSDLVIVNQFLGVSLQFYWGLILAALVWFFYELTPAGRRLLFVGRGRSVARLSGIRVDRVRIYALMASAGFAGIGGIIFTGTTGGADPTSGTTFLLPAFAAAYLGSTALKPGRFNPIGTVVAVYFLVTGITGLQLLGAETYVQQLFYGGALAIAVISSSVVRKRRLKAAAKVAAG
jgi:ribose transport system permease protein